ncbi:MFS transporter [Streptomyces mobaraensis NBRC 13819 = DSM 40847]|uniref:Major facilitator superfamily transporter n=1 Tax=Streptomyces mobaraensis (strain ATCC 29032 / DSM 40847 / JCM 4168 / NBRC 13819 / NCIMB 11159 / IPCR 16-22) TaxID=1223523 RepID=M3BZC2_STRM1|nr:MFS transporter [Streptomyces mobaraensis]EME97041.1 major facilitator superfamily transporter [Streptomyces mobaraensis NBRC 13819 = DSM 40847]QTT75243.1 MFS transporter [Streptomyces mobaraensis NBRC 13819 = DSM 40847]
MPGNSEAATRRTESRSRDEPAFVLSRGLVLLFAVACGAAVANVYFSQPLLVTMGHDLAMSPALVGSVVTLTQTGYGLGLFFLVPLGDIADRRRLIVAQLLLLVGALALVAAARSAAVLLAGMAATGLLAVVTQTLVAFAASLAPPAGRGRVVGLVTSGVVVGILLARTASGLLADLAGWRSVYVASASLTALLALVLHRVLPRRGATPPTPLRYGPLLRSTLTLFARERLLRLRAAFCLLVFASFSTLWSSVALPLSEAPYHLSHSAIGALGLIGVAGALAASVAGRLNDRGLSRRTTGIALALLTASWLPLALTRHSFWALVVGVVLLDLAVQAVHVTNQTLIYALHPDAGSRLIGGYMVFYSIGSAVGALAATSLYAAAGWGAVCALGAGFSLLGFLLWALPRGGSAESAPRR